MPQGNAIVRQLLRAAIAVSLTIAAADAADSGSSALVISVYTYGVAAPVKTAPETEMQQRVDSGATGQLTDVVSVPPLARPTPPPKTDNVVNQPIEPVTPIFPMEPSAGGGGSAGPAPQVVTLGWYASPDPSVVGYQLYIGSASGEYNITQQVGNQTSATIVLDRPIAYVAVSALTADGLESPLSAELVVTASNQPGP